MSDGWINTKRQQIKLEENKHQLGDGPGAGQSAAGGRQLLH